MQKKYSPWLIANLAIALALGAAVLFGADPVHLFQVAMSDPSIAGGVLLANGAGALELKALETAMNKAFETMQENIKKVQDTASNALEESRKLGGVIEAKTNDKLKELGENGNKMAADFKTLREQVVELAQKMSTVPQGGGAAQKSIAEIVASSDEYKRAQKANRMDPVEIPSALLRTKTQIVNATFDNNQPLVAPARVGGIITPAQQRLYIRDLLPQATTDTNLIDFASEATFTNNAGVQGNAGGSPIGTGEGEQFVESAMTFTLSNAPVVTIGHWIPASRQVLSDAKMLQGHISGRLIYGLALQEETQLLTGTGAAGTINGINNQAAAFTGGVTNATILDTLLRAMLQVSLSNYELSAYILHPTDWFAAMLLKDSQNRYLFSDPQAMVAPRVWAKPVVPSQSQAVGKFTAGAFDLGAQIWDRETASVRVSENVNDHFIRNMVAILVEERLALAVYRTTAFVYGSTSFAG